MAALVVAALSIAATPGFAATTKLKCFSHSPATCSIGAGPTATLDTSSGGFAGVYVQAWRFVSGVAIGNVDFSFNYICPGSNDTTSCTGGGAVRWSIPIDTNGDGRWNFFAFVDAANCGNTGTVDNGNFCHVFAGNESFTDWAAFAAAHPTYTIANNSVPFVISDVPKPSVTISNVSFG